MPKIHPTALVDPGAKIADDVVIGPYGIVEADVEIGPGCELRSHAIVRRFTTLGRGNLVDSFAVLGGEPQDLKFDGQTVSYLRIGDENTFREGVTISRATAPGGATTVGSRGFWMAASHAAHDTTIGDDVVFVNSASIAGHARIGNRVILGGGAGVHQFCRVGEGVMLQGNGGLSTHAPPFVTCRGVNIVFGLNRVGLRRRDDTTAEDVNQVLEAFRILYRSKLRPATALVAMDKHDDWGTHATKFREFVREALQAEPPFRRGLCTMRTR